ncbi:MAG: SusD/RagB family nutrient-binding outer membrane lipoprotein, partial [Bacteroidales bacterium]|nr:SusD/RagB family nutrient-binding outer membrane lipoprotein [Bacteroidales bacterium]
MKIHIDYFGVICTVIALFLMYSCTKDFEDINTKKSAIMSVGAGEYAELFTSAIENGLGWSTTDDMSRMSSTLAMHNAGYTACGMPTYDEYLLGLGWENSGFKDIYVSALPPLFAIIDNAKAAGDSVPYSVAQIWKVFLFDLATDVWGPIPYSEACSGKEAVPYDSQKDVYYMMFDDLSNAVRVLNNALKVNP